MPVVLLTSTFLRHRFMIMRAAQVLDVVGVWQEEHLFNPFRQLSSGSDDEEIVSEHFRSRDKCEEKFFGAFVQQQERCQKMTWRAVGAKGINQPAEMELICSLKPDLILVYGTGLIGSQLISRFPGKIINLHLGLSPYYRGAGTNFWPLVNREPEYVGATVHYLDAGIDAGPIIAQVRPMIESGDGPHDIGNKAIEVGVELLIKVASAHERRGPLPAVAQQGKGRLYRMKDFNAGALRKLQLQFQTGMIEDYLANRTIRDEAIPPVNCLSEK